METNVGALDLSDELVDQFCAVTGADRTIGRQLLDICHGNLEMAIGMHMDQDPGERNPAALAALDQPTTSGSSAGSSSFPPPQRHRFHRSIHSDPEPGAAATVEEEDLNQNGLRAPIPQRHEVLVEETPKYGFRGRRRTVQSVFDGFRDFQAEARQQENMLVTGTRPQGKKNTLEDLFRPPIDITFKGSFHAARDRGKSENKWLMVNIQNVQEFSCQVLNRDIWSNFTIKGLVKKHFIFWQVYHDSEEGKKFMQFYSVSKWPHVAVIDPVTGENLVTWDKMDGVSFPDLLKDFLEDHPNPHNSDIPPAKRQKRENSIVDESEEAQIEAAIRASLSQADDSGPAASASASSSTTTTTTTPLSFPSATAIHPTTVGIETDDSEQSEDEEAESDELETFTGSEESSDAVSRNNPLRRERAATTSAQPRSFSAVSAAGGGPGQGRSSRPGVRTQDGAWNSAAGASGVPFSRLVPSMSSDSGSFPLRGVVGAVVEDSENDNSLGFRESLGGNTPNSMDLMGGRSLEFHTLDSSGSRSSTLGSSEADPDEDTVGCDKPQGQMADGDADASTAVIAAPWREHFGEESDPSTNIVVRFPDGKKEQLSLPCSSKLQALFVFCQSKGFAQEAYELVVNFPRRSLSCMDPDSTILQAQLHPQETVFVQAR